MKNAIFVFMCLYFSPGVASEAIGFYSKGKLAAASSVFERGTPVHKLFIARARTYTSDEMHEILTSAAEFVAVNFPSTEPLQVGDLSNRQGGEAKGHASHQNGLDADLVYRNQNHHIQSPDASVWDEDFVGKNAPTSNFSVEKNFALFKYLAINTTTERIFVDQQIKRALCQYVEKNGIEKEPEVIETLRRLRPQDLHRTHFHIRISCPPNDRECTPQSLPPTDSGCDDLSILLSMAEKIHTC